MRLTAALMIGITTPMIHRIFFTTLIEKYLNETFDEAYLSDVLSGTINKNALIVECLYSMLTGRFERNMPLNTARSYYTKDLNQDILDRDEVSLRDRDMRNRKRAQIYTKMNIDQITKLASEYNINLRFNNNRNLSEELKLEQETKCDTSNFNEGYLMSEMTHYEYNVFNRVKLFSHISNGSISSIKKVSNNELDEFFKEYLSEHKSLIERSQKSDIDYIFANYEALNLERQYRVLFWLSVAREMAMRGIKELTYDQFMYLITLSGIGKPIVEYNSFHHPVIDHGQFFLNSFDNISFVFNNLNDEAILMKEIRRRFELISITDIYNKEMNPIIDSCYPYGYDDLIDLFKSLHVFRLYKSIIMSVFVNDKKTRRQIIRCFRNCLRFFSN